MPAKCNGEEKQRGILWAILPKASWNIEPKGSNDHWRTFRIDARVCVIHTLMCALAIREETGSNCQQRTIGGSR